jgi:hypothetical protein
MNLLRQLRILAAQLKTRNRADREKQSRLPDYWARSVSFAALLISIATLFYSFFLHRDHISIVVLDTPAALRNADGSVWLMALDDPTITFINSGTRSAAITYFAATAKVLIRGEPKECNGQELGDIFTLPVSIPSLILKPGEITSVKVQIPEKGQADSIKVPKDIYTAKPGDQVLVCLHFDVVTPDSISRVRTIPAALVTFDKSFGDDLDIKGRPTDVLREWNIHLW